MKKVKDNTKDEKGREKTGATKNGLRSLLE